MQSLDGWTDLRQSEWFEVCWAENFSVNANAAKYTKTHVRSNELFVH